MGKGGGGWTSHSSPTTFEDRPGVISGGRVQRNEFCPDPRRLEVHPRRVATFPPTGSSSSTPTQPHPPSLPPPVPDSSLGREKRKEVPFRPLVQTVPVPNPRVSPFPCYRTTKDGEDMRTYLP